MGLQFAAARAVSAVSTWGLKHVFHRPAANFPGKIALYADPRVIADLAPRLQKGSVCVVGTNGKTTVTNLLADALETAGQRVVCNRTGANLDSGVATALLHAREADWGVFECDELWLAKILPHLQANYVVLLNLFRDQLDRVGEIDRIQESIAGALATSPKTTLVFNADDPLCAAIAERVGNPTVAFGVDEDLHLPQNTVADAQMCQRCSAMLEYAYRQYGQLGSYCCPACGFARPSLDCAARDVHLGADGLSFAAHGPRGDAEIKAPFSGAYMVYNLLATWAAADLVSVPAEALQRAIDAFDPRNGRLQEFAVAGRRTLLNLAKNPTGFNQNIKIILQDEGPKAVAFFVNDKEGDGRDVSWLWDIDFEELAGQSGLRVFAGGIRKNDVQVRLKYAGLDAALVDDAAGMFAQLDGLPADARAYVIANYTALPPVHAELGRLADGGQAAGAPLSPKPSEGLSGSGGVQAAEDDAAPLVIAHLFPDLLNLYGDGGNVKVLERRARERGIPVEVRRVNHGEHVDLAGVDLVFLGGGPDREQRLASEDLMRMRDDLHAYVEDDGVLLAICGGFQILGHEWLLGEEVVKGLGLVDMTTERAPGGSGNRLIGNIALRSPLADQAVVGYENHAGRTHLGTGVEAFGDVASSTGHGNNDSDKRDGVRYKNVVGTYLHGPLLPKNPQVADALLIRALERRARRAGVPAPELAPLDDAVENAANEYVRNRLNAG
ncbi:MurT ligase domain-containing protein [Gordonibacter pamelaeae]|uniref:MurT ligase domain-containing protein n=1 Tax=Gordonibacter pamelaeae TaxID=471189 RepID=UPI001D08397D|nr:MurT ligase domain-containing protein [Gordonibacter pamelaeae]MCB6310693.1 MurT ligase domain-containing protein [Gordonibacter pamelaeae]